MKKTEKKSKPLGREGLKVMRRIVRKHSYEEIDGILIDAFSANAFVKVHDALSEENQAKLLTLNPVTAMNLVWKLVA